MKSPRALWLLVSCACGPAPYRSPQPDTNPKPSAPQSALIKPAVGDKVGLIVIADAKASETVHEAKERAAGFLRQCVGGSDAPRVSVVVVGTWQEAAKVAGAGRRKPTVLFEVAPVGPGISLKVSAMERNGGFRAVGGFSERTGDAAAVADTLEDGGAAACQAWYGSLSRVSLELTCQTANCDDVVGSDSRFETKGAETITEMPWSSFVPVLRRTAPYHWNVYLKDGRRFRASVYTGDERLRCSKSIPEKNAKPGVDGWIDVGRCP